MNWRAWFRRRPWEGRMDAEFRFHLENQINDYIAQGLGREQAESLARREFGEVDWRKTSAATKTCPVKTNEIGLRMALGADGRDIFRMVLRQVVVLALIGIALGVLGAVFLTRLLANLLFEVRPTDPLTFAAVAIGLMSVALLAAYLPAWRTTRVDPTVALRTE